jgi:hypothetical protein
MEDGTPPGKAVSIERFCVGKDPTIAAITSKTGVYLWRVEGDPFSGLDMLRSANSQALVARGAYRYGQCFLTASLKGYQSTA